MLRIDEELAPPDLLPRIDILWEASGRKLRRMATRPVDQGSPVVTVSGRYTSRSWTDWTLGFWHGSALLQFDATADRAFLRLGRAATFERMSPHLTNMGVHDHGFNIVSTFGNLYRLALEGRTGSSKQELATIALALKVSGAVQAARWTKTGTSGFIYSFNGPHSLFIDTMRSLRSLALAHQLGQYLLLEHDGRVDLLARLIDHAQTTAQCSVYYGEGRDAYDVRGRVAHESVFNTLDGRYRCPNSQQGWSPFTTWTRGLAWAVLGFAEQLEWLKTRPESEPVGVDRGNVDKLLLKAAMATSDFYIANAATDGIPYWDTGAPGLLNLGFYLDRAADPFNDFEPVDSSAAAIASQGLLRLGHHLMATGDRVGRRYWQAGLTVARTLLSAAYLSEGDNHDGLLLHSVYHRPNGWDYIPGGRVIPCGEASMWGDYHLRELAVYIGRVAQRRPYHTFFGPVVPNGG